MPQNRLETGRFSPGRSGNPGGRPKGLARLTREKVGEDGEKIVQFWIDVMGDPNWKGSERLRASELLADRGWGRSPQFIPVEADDPLGLSEQELDEEARRFDEEIARLAKLHEVDRIGGEVQRLDGAPLTPPADFRWNGH